MDGILDGILAAPLRPAGEDAGATDRGQIIISLVDGRVHVAWQGGETVTLTHTFLTTAVAGVVTWAAFPERPGDRFCVGPYSLEVVAWCGTLPTARRAYW